MTWGATYSISLLPRLTAISLPLFVASPFHIRLPFLFYVDIASFELLDLVLRLQ